MPAPVPTRSSSAPLPGWMLAGLLVVAGVAAYWNSLSVPFLFDDRPAILENPTIRSLGTAWSPPVDGSSVAGRPLVNFTLALNYAAGGLQPAGYHAFNLTVHLLAALVLFGLVRRTLEQPVLRERYQNWSQRLALLIAGWWMLHPLQTESVTCVIQRNELLAGLFYLLTVYCFVRGWRAASLAACLLGVVSKEVVATAPLLVLLYDRTFVAGSFAAAWRQRKGYYLLLGATWILLGWLVINLGGSRGTAAGFGLGVSPWAYLLTQCDALVIYLRLSVCPYPLVLDYGTAVAGGIGAVWWQGLLVLGLLGGTIWALVRRPVLGFVGSWFFVILAPSSSFIPLVEQTIAEHRMYLALAAPVTFLVLGLHAAFGRRGWWAGMALAAGFGLLTVARNADYHTALGIWADTVKHRPGNPRARQSLGHELIAANRPAEAIEQLEEALRLQPDYAEAHLALGNARALMGDSTAALQEYERAVAADPQYAEGRLNLGYALAQAGRLDEAKLHYAAALQLRPDYAEAHNNLGEVLAMSGDLPAAGTQFETALRLQPDYAQAHNNLAGIRLQQGRPAEAIPHFEEALRLKPDFAEAHSNLAYALLQGGRADEAAGHYEQLLQLEPDNTTAHNNLGFIRWRQGRTAEAVAQYEATLRVEPDNAAARAALAQLRR